MRAGVPLVRPAVRKLRRLSLTVGALPPAAVARAVLEGAWRGLLLAWTVRRAVVTVTPNVAPVARALVVADRPTLPGRPRRSEWREGADGWPMAPVVAALLELGCEVDVVGDRAIAAIPPGEYQLLVAPPDALGRLAAALPASCVKVLHLNEPDVVFQNAAELDRLLALRDRRGVVLAPVRYRRVGDAFDAADHVVVQGNGWTVSTYRHVGQPIHAVPAVCDVELPSPARKDFERHGGRFVWLGGGGCVHQGLDLVLEAFAQLPGCQLTVCGPVAREEAFAAAYARELYRLPNVKFEGDLGVRGRRFAAVTERATAFILPSGGEGQAVEAVRCLGAGLIPIVSRECGIDVDDFGVVLEESSVLAIKESASAVSALPASRKRDLAMLAWNAARARHAPSVVAARWRDLLAQLLAPVLASVATGGTRRESSSPSSGTPR